MKSFLPAYALSFIGVVPVSRPTIPGSERQPPKTPGNENGKMPKTQIGSGLRTDARAGLTGQMQDRVRRF
jgi:hypothetical protein